jgi:hypothetical protein
LRLWRRYSLSVILAGLWAISWTIQTGAGLVGEILQLITMVVLTAVLVQQVRGDGQHHQEQANRLETKVDAVLEQVQRIQMHLTRLSTADHVFEPLIPGDTSELAMCVTPACLLRRRQHPHSEGTL